MRKKNFLSDFCTFMRKFKSKKAMISNSINIIFNVNFFLPVFQAINLIEKLASTFSVILHSASSNTTVSIGAFFFIKSSLFLNSIKLAVISSSAQYIRCRVLVYGNTKSIIVIIIKKKKEMSKTIRTKRKKTQQISAKKREKIDKFKG